MTYTKTEHEAIILYAVWDMIDEMVNFGMFEKPNSFYDINLMFCTSSHRRLFNILLVDFLSLPTKAYKSNELPWSLPEPASTAVNSGRTFLFYLKTVCANPQFNLRPDNIEDAIDKFSNWLDEECLVEKVWFSTISTELNIKATRIELLKICGDIGKHNFSRLQANVRKICKILKDNGVDIDEGKGFKLLPEFYAWFHDDFFAYHASTIAEFLNNIRWSIFYYLEPEYVRSFEEIDPIPMYKFKYPSECIQELPKAMYWNLMNKVRSSPDFPLFTVTQSLKKRY